MKFFKALIISMFLPVFSFGQHVKHPPLTKATTLSLRREIIEMHIRGQMYRYAIRNRELDSQKMAGPGKNQSNCPPRQTNRIRMSRAWRDSQWTYQREIDSTNFVKLSGIISKYGFPKSYVDTWEVMTILLHSTDRMNADFLRQLKEEVFAGNLEAVVYAQIYDRVQADRNLPRLYYVPEPLGSTSDTSKIGKPAHSHVTNKARKEIGLKKWKR